MYKKKKKNVREKVYVMDLAMLSLIDFKFISQIFDVQLYRLL